MARGATVKEQRTQAAALSTALNKDLAHVLRRGDEPIRKLALKSKKKWDYILENVAEGHFHKTDALLLQQYCDVLVKLEELTARLPNEDIESFSTRGTPVPNPFYNVFNTLSLQAMNLAQRLRLMPAMRQMSQSEKDSQDPSVLNARRVESKRAHLLFGGQHGNVAPIRPETNEDDE